MHQVAFKLWFAYAVVLCALCCAVPCMAFADDAVADDAVNAASVEAGAEEIVVEEATRDACTPAVASVAADAPANAPAVAAAVSEPVGAESPATNAGVVEAALPEPVRDNGVLPETAGGAAVDDDAAGDDAGSDDAVGDNAPSAVVVDNAAGDEGASILSVAAKQDDVEGAVDASADATVSDAAADAAAAANAGSAASSTQADAAEDVAQADSVGAAAGTGDSAKAVAAVTTAPANASTKAPTTGASGETWDRVWGSEALDTMSEVVQEGWSSSNSVVVATSANYKDALSASPLAGYLKAPILLTYARSLPDQTKAEIARLGARIAYIVGGEKAISANVESQIKQAGCGETVRIWGEYAQDTAVAVADYLAGKHSSTAIVATDVSFQDALSIAPYAYKTVSPIYLTSGNGLSLGSGARKSIADGGYRRAVVVGGPSVVKSNVVYQLNSTGISNVERLWGQNAEGTSSEIANWSVSQGMTARNVGVATSTDYRDALVGGALCGKNNSPIVLVSAKNRSVIYSFLNGKRSGISKGYVFGGTAVVSGDTHNLVVKGTGKTVYSNFAGYNVNGFTKVGVDVSFWQEDIDWNKVKASGVDFAIVRAGYGSDYASQDDRYFLRNVAGAKAAGIELGIYLFSYAKDTSMARSEADHAIRLLRAAGLKSSDLPFGVYYDLEWANMEKTSNRSLLLNMTKAFTSRIKSAGYKVGVYANLNWWRNYLPSDEYNQWSRWIAQYNSECTYFGPYNMWQFRSNGSVPGIKGNADLNLCYV